MFPSYLMWPQKSYMPLDVFVTVNQKKKKKKVFFQKNERLPDGHCLDTTLRKAFVHC